MATIRQMKAVEKLAENGGSIGEAMRAGGYSHVSSLTPKKLTESKGFKELFEKKIKDSLLIKKNKELLNAEIKKTVTRNGETVHEETKIDTFAIAKGLDLAYRVKGAYAPDKHAHLNVNIDVQNNPESQKLVDEYEQKFQKMLQC